MKITTRVAGGRKVWELDNDALTLSIMQGGGHLAGLELHAGPKVNPFWRPLWRTIEPWAYRAADAPRYGNKLLACISGHNLCLHEFGDPSPEEQRAGLVCHGEAPVARWRVLARSRSRRGLRFMCGCDLPIAQMRLERTFVMPRGSNVIQVQERVTNLARRDVPFTMCEHVTFGPPFLEPGVTVFDAPATKGHTFPGAFSDRPRMKPDTAFTWPAGPGLKGTVDLRRYETQFRSFSDFTTQLMNPARAEAWFSAVNPRLGLLVAYVWRREDFPWLANWEELRGRAAKPWGGRSLTRGMEFANTPFPQGLRTAVDRGRFHGRPTFRWLPARGSWRTAYSILAERVPAGCAGVADIRTQGAGFSIDLML